MLDNIRMNKAMMNELRKLFKEREISYDPKENHIPCFPHIINISKISTSDAPDADDCFELDDLPNFDSQGPPGII